MRQALVVAVILGRFCKLFSDDVLGHVDAIVLHLMRDVVKEVIQYENDLLSLLTREDLV